jgi:hypothetical protein
MAKDYIIEIREVYDNKYLKVTLKDNDDIGNVSKLLSNLNSVKTANVTKQTSGVEQKHPIHTYLKTRRTTKEPSNLNSYHSISREKDISIAKHFCNGWEFRALWRIN